MLLGLYMDKSMLGLCMDKSRLTTKATCAYVSPYYKRTERRGLNVPENHFKTSKFQDFKEYEFIFILNCR